MLIGFHVYSEGIWKSFVRYLSSIGIHFKDVGVYPLLIIFNFQYLLSWTFWNLEGAQPGGLGGWQFVSFQPSRSSFLLIIWLLINWWKRMERGTCKHFCELLNPVLLISECIHLKLACSLDPKQFYKHQDYIKPDHCIMMVKLTLLEQRSKDRAKFVSYRRFCS